jgi:hypothetical protein
MISSSKRNLSQISNNNCNNPEPKKKRGRPRKYIPEMLLSDIDMLDETLKKKTVTFPPDVIQKEVNKEMGIFGGGGSLNTNEIGKGIFGGQSKMTAQATKSDFISKKMDFPAFGSFGSNISTPSSSIPVTTLFSIPVTTQSNGIIGGFGSSTSSAGGLFGANTSSAGLGSSTSSAGGLFGSSTSSAGGLFGANTSSAGLGSSASFGGFRFNDQKTGTNQSGGFVLSSQPTGLFGQSQFPGKSSSLFGQSQFPGKPTSPFGPRPSILQPTGFGSFKPKSNHLFGTPSVPVSTPVSTSSTNLGVDSLKSQAPPFENSSVGDSDNVFFDQNHQFANSNNSVLGNHFDSTYHGDNLQKKEFLTMENICPKNPKTNQFELFPQFNFVRIISVGEDKIEFLVTEVDKPGYFFVTEVSEDYNNKIFSIIRKLSSIEPNCITKNILYNLENFVVKRYIPRNGLSKKFLNDYIHYLWVSPYRQTLDKSIGVMSFAQIKKCFIQICNIVLFFRGHGMFFSVILPKMFTVKYNVVSLKDFYFIELHPNEFPQKYKHCVNPERLKNENKIDSVWGLAILLFRMIYKKYPFQGETVAELLESIKNYSTPPQPSFISDQTFTKLSILFSSIFKAEIDNRPSFINIIDLVSDMD